MFFKIDPTNGLPIYLQIINQVKTNIAMGRVLPEEPLPSVRQLAVELAVNPNTVARAYLDLEHEGVIYKRPGQGTFVSRQGVEMSKRDRVKALMTLVEKSVVEAVNLELGEADIRGTFEAVLERILNARQAGRSKAK
jgi:GntR family transcriptional regulator